MNRNADFLNSILDTLNSIIYIFDIEKQSIVYTNTQVENVTGYTIGELQAFGNDFVSSFFHKQTKTLQSIVIGNKSVEAENSKQNGFQTFFSVLWFVVPFLAFFYGSSLKTENHTENNRLEQHKEYENEHEHDND